MHSSEIKKFDKFEIMGDSGARRFGLYQYVKYISSIYVFQNFHLNYTK